MPLVDHAYCFCKNVCVCVYCIYVHVCTCVYRYVEARSCLSLLHSTLLFELVFHPESRTHEKARLGGQQALGICQSPNPQLSHHQQ